MNRYPLLLKPVLKDYLWGGRRLIDEFKFETDKDIAAEAWMLSAHKDGTSIVLNGEFEGKTINEVFDLWGLKPLPILIKLIDAKQKLSVQVHPDDEYAFKNEGENGKTEMWYVIDCEPNSQLAYGFKETIEKAEFEQRIKDNTLDEVINYVPVKRGDVFFITAGTLHAIGDGILIAEVQQNSNSTYRVSDYGRLGTDGKPRELHIEKALDVTKTCPPEMPYGSVGEIKEFNYGTERTLANCELFRVDALILDGSKKTGNLKNPVSLLIIDGDIKVKYPSAEISAKKGDSILIPSGLDTEIIGKAQMILSSYSLL